MRNCSASAWDPARSDGAQACCRPLVHQVPGSLHGAQVLQRRFSLELHSRNFLSSSKTAEFSGGRLKVGTSKLPVLDVGLRAQPDSGPSPNPCVRLPPATRTKPFGLNRCCRCAKARRQGALCWRAPRGVPCLGEPAEQIKVVFFQIKDQRG